MCKSYLGFQFLVYCKKGNFKNGRYRAERDDNVLYLKQSIYWTIFLVCYYKYVCKIWTNMGENKNDFVIKEYF